MLSTAIYNRALNLALENLESARNHRNEQEVHRQLDIFRRIIEYGDKHGLALNALDQGGNVVFRFRRNGYRPDTLHIEIEYEG